MSGIVRGKNALITFDIDGTFKPVACGTSVEIETELETLEITDRFVGDWRSFIGYLKSGTGSVEGVVYTTPPSGQISPGAVQQAQWNEGAARITFEMIGDDLTSYMFSSDIIITKVRFSGEAGAGLAIYTIDFVLSNNSALGGGGTGDGPIIARYWDYIATGGETVVLVNVAFATIDVINVARNGIGLDIITSGTPNDNQVLVSGKTLTFSDTLPLNPDEHIHVLFNA